MSVVYCYLCCSKTIAPPPKSLLRVHAWYLECFFLRKSNWYTSISVWKFVHKIGYQWKLEIFYFKVIYIFVIQTQNRQQQKNTFYLFINVSKKYLTSKDQLEDSRPFWKHPYLYYNMIFHTVKTHYSKTINSTSTIKYDEYIFRKSIPVAPLCETPRHARLKYSSAELWLTVGENVVMGLFTHWIRWNSPLAAVLLPNSHWETSLSREFQFQKAYNTNY